MKLTEQKLRELIIEELNTLNEKKVSSKDMKKMYALCREAIVEEVEGAECFNIVEWSNADKKEIVNDFLESSLERLKEQKEEITIDNLEILLDSYDFIKEKLWSYGAWLRDFECSDCRHGECYYEDDSDW